MRPHGAARGPAASALAANAQFLELDPSLLVVSCERIRQALTRELGLTSPWQGRIHVFLQPVMGEDDAVTVAVEQFRDGWGYRLHLPEVIERRRLMRALVEVLLLEMANRHSSGRSPELPAWLAVGLAEQLLASAGTELLFAPPHLRAGALTLSPRSVTTRSSDPLAAARALLRERAPLTLQELSWPTEQDFTGDTAAGYRASAQLFVAELLRLRNGPACFRALLQELPRHYNWQTAFLKAFQQHFQRLLDVEKWWAVQVVYSSGRDQAHTWSAAESWRKLDAALRVPAQVRAATNALPTGTADVPLQTVIAEWDFVRQTTALRTRIQQLNLLRQRVAPELLPLTDAYRRVLATHLEQRDKAGMVLAQGRVARPAHRRLAQDTVRQLNELDAQFALFQRDASPALEPAEAPRPATQP
jgi:hypothetical protein